MASDSSDMRFPLPEHQRPRVDIDPQTIAEWKVEAQCAISSLLMDRSSWFYRFDASDPGFTHSYDKNGTRGCTREIPGTNTVEYLSQGELPMTLEDVVYAMYCDTSQQQRIVHAQLYQEIFLDSAILELYEPATASDPFHRVAMVWTAVCPKSANSCLSWTFASARDYLYFDLSCTTKDAEGRPVLVNYRKSHDLRPHELLQDHSLSMTRVFTYGITTFCLHDSERVVMTALGHIALKNTFSTVLLQRIMPVIYNRELNHMGLVAAKNLQAIGITTETLVEKHSEQDSMCNVCHRGFGILRKRRWCRGCGHATCRGCYMKVALLKEGVLLGPCIPIVKARFCLRCLLHASEQRFKSELEHERMMSERQSQVQWWEDINLVGTNSIDGFLDQHRENLELSDDDDDDTDLTHPSVAVTCSFSSSDSGQQDEFGLSVAKSEELVHVAASVADHAARLRQMHQEQFSGMGNCLDR